MDEQHRHRRRAGQRDDHLTRLLRDRDPATADTGLDPVDLANMRQVITASVERSETGPSWAGAWPAWTKPALAAATVAVVAMGVWMFNESLTGEAPKVADSGVTAPGSTSTQPGAEAEIAPGPVPDSAPAAPNSVAEATAEAADTTDLVAGLDPETPAIASTGQPSAAEAAAPDATNETNTVTGNTTTPPENAAMAGVDDLSPTDKQARTVQFTAPRGTRIIWTLDPNFESPIAGQEPRQEQSQ